MKTRKPTPPMAPRVDVRRRGARRGVDPRTVARRAARIMLAMGASDAELSIVLCDDPFIRELNSRYRGKDKATDVLSFPLADENGELGPAPMLGDIVISLDTAARQAAARRATLLDEVTALLIHGALHLVGHDHENDADAAKMEAEAARIEEAVTAPQKRRIAPLTSPKSSSKRRPPRGSRKRQ